MEYIHIVLGVLSEGRYRKSKKIAISDKCDVFFSFFFDISFTIWTQNIFVHEVIFHFTKQDDMSMQKKHAHYSKQKALTTGFILLGQSADFFQEKNNLNVI